MSTKHKRPVPLAVISPIHKAGRQIALHLGRQTAQLKIAPAEAHLLTYLYLYGPCPVSDLIGVFGHKNSTMTSMLVRLDKRGYITRRINPDDHRSFLIGVTAAGGRLASHARRIVEVFDRKVQHSVSKSDLRAFQRVLEVVAGLTGVEVRRPGPEEKNETQK